ncbi:hypothetical protein ACF9IK_17910 [Kitasatospora hibisci]|uniref:hypothetical protein n=1 Tax=Kitasatospora hibisci TaxID=3369522 RepID=UPI00375400F9
MRKSVINRFAKNDRAFSGRRALATLATTVVLAGGVQLLATDTAWACGDIRYGTPPAIDSGQANTALAPVADFRDPLPATISADGSWTEFGVGMVNFTGADLPNVEPSFGLANVARGLPLRAADVRVEVMTHGAWKPLKLNQGCTGLGADLRSLRTGLADGRSANLLFRVSLSPNAPQGLNEVTMVTDASAGNGEQGRWGYRTVRVIHPKAAAPAAKPATAAKPVPAQPAAAKPAAAAKPVPAQTADGKAVAAPVAPAAPATGAPTTAAPATAPAGTAELAQTGADASTGLLAAASAAVLALGAGVMIAVRRLRPQR